MFNNTGRIEQQSQLKMNLKKFTTKETTQHKGETTGNLNPNRGL